MKLIKIVLTAVIVMLAAWTSNAQGTSIQYYRFEKINFSLRISQQVLSNSPSGSGNVWTVKTMKMGNKELLRYLAEVFHTHWPAGAQLALYGDIRDINSVDREICVLDKDGNLLINGNLNFPPVILYGTNPTNQAYFRVNYGLSVQARKDANEGSLETSNASCSRILSFQLYRNEDDPSVYTDLEFQGLGKEKYRVNLNNSTYSRSMSEHAHLCGDGVMNNTWTVVSGHVSIAGKWVINLD